MEMITRGRVGVVLATALVGCTSLLGIDKRYVEAEAEGGSPVVDGGGAIDAPSDSTTSLPFGWKPPAVAIAAGWNASCALSSGGFVSCWGDNEAGVIGDGTTAARLRPVLDAPRLGAPALAVAVGGASASVAHSCALLVGGGASCWGAADAGQLGAVVEAGVSTVPVSVIDLAARFQDAGGVDAAADGGGGRIAAGGAFTCATLGGPIYCWGANGSGQLGNGKQVASTIPVQVSTLDGVKSLSAGQAHACAIARDGAYCWGANDSGQIGNTTGVTERTVPEKLVGGADAIAVAAGGNHTCMLHQTGVVECWGEGDNGQVGHDPDPDYGYIPGAVTWPNKQAPLVAVIAAGLKHTCAIDVGGAVYCWGANHAGQLGDGTTTDRQTPVPVRGITAGAAALALGASHSCALLADRSIKCWGSAGHVGSAAPGGSVVPVPVPF